MFLQKRMLSTIACVVMNLPFIANADPSLTTTNNTNYNSAVKVISSPIKPCSGQIGEYTPAHQEKTTTWNNVKILCLGSGSLCRAEIYMTKDCTGAAVAVASLDLSNPNVTVEQILNSSYNITANGTHVFLNMTSHG